MSLYAVSDANFLSTYHFTNEEKRELYQAQKNVNDRKAIISAVAITGGILVLAPLLYSICVSRMSLGLLVANIIATQLLPVTISYFCIRLAEHLTNIKKYEKNLEEVKLRQKTFEPQDLSKKEEKPEVASKKMRELKIYKALPEDEDFGNSQSIEEDQL